MALLVSKIRLMLAGKKTVATTITLVIVEALKLFGIVNLDPDIQKAIETILMGLIVIFMRLGIAKNDK